ncbi:hypothetical protein CEXT_229541, partial [Caerostris extrusa]
LILPHQDWQSRKSSQENPRNKAPNLTLQENAIGRKCRPLPDFSSTQRDFLAQQIRRL